MPVFADRLVRISILDLALSIGGLINVAGSGLLGKKCRRLDRIRRITPADFLRNPALIIHIPASRDRFYSTESGVHRLGLSGESCSLMSKEIKPLRDLSKLESKPSRVFSLKTKPVKR